MALTARRGKVPVTFGLGKRWAARLRLGVGVLLSFYILLVSNIICFRHPVRLDLTENRTHTLSKATLDKLKLVPEEIRVVIPTFLVEGNQGHVAQRQVLLRARSLLNEYMAAQPRIKIAAEVDALEEADRWLQVRKNYDLTGAQVNRFLFFAGDSKEFRQAVTPQDMATLGDPRDVGGPPELKEFHGEKAITDAITRLIERRKRKVYFTQDKEELTLRPEVTQAAQPSFLVTVRHELETQGMEARELSIATSDEVPSDCELLVIAGPYQPYSSREVDVIRKYLQGGGRLFVALGPRRTGLEDLLEGWAVKVLDGSIQGVRERLEPLGPPTRTTSGWVTARRFNGMHPITRVFQNVPRFELRLFGPRPLSAETRERLEASSLIETPRAEGESYYLVKEGKSGEAPKRGDFQIAACVEQRVPARPPPDFQRLDTRIVVVGARNFLDDRYFDQVSHRDFFMNCVAWLLGEGEKATVGGQEWAERTLKMSPSIRRFLFWVPIFLFPGVFLCAGMFVYYLRRA